MRQSLKFSYYIDCQVIRNNFSSLFTMTNSVFIIDNGAYTVKAGLSSAEDPQIIPNCIMKTKSEKRRLFIGNQIQECRDLSGLFYILPYQKGYLSNLEFQKQIWDYVFSMDLCNVDFSEIPLIFTEPCFNFPSIQETITEIFFEEYNCQSLLRVNSTELSAYNHFQRNEKAVSCVIVDSGYSFTYIVPYIDGVKYKNGIVRIDVGGKLLTNHLKDIISYRQLHVMEETHVINQVKEDICYVTDCLHRDMEIARKKHPENTIVRDYILPDYTTVRRGYARTVDLDPLPEYQSLRLTNERFTVPEILFHPSDIGIDQMGIPEAIAHSISLCPEDSRPLLLENIVLTGGNCLFPGYKQRVYNGVRALTRLDFDVNVFLPKNPITYAWHGGSLFSNDSEFYTHVVTKEEYKEEGYYVCYEKFDV